MDKRLVAVFIFAFVVATVASLMLYHLAFDTPIVLAPAK
jgi:hypothetical protein